MNRRGILRPMSGLWKHLRPYLVVALLGAPLVWPLLRGAVPCTHDGQLYYYQTAALQHGFENGLIYSRWLPDAALGYGIPLFNYREPLPRYLLAGLAETGLPLPLALNLLMTLCLLATGWGSYRLARDVFQDELSALLSGAAAMAAPYLLLNVYRRGALPECAALALTPWVWWAFWRIGHGHKRAPILAAILWAALILTHNISALLMAPALLAYAALLAYLSADHPRDLLSPRRWLRPLTGFLGGVGLAAFYWIPAFFEKDLIQIGAAVSTRNNSYLFNFVGLRELLSPPTAHNLALLNPPLRITLGLPLVLLAAVGLVGGWLAYRDRSRRAHLAFFAIIAALYLLMVTPLSRPLWDAIPTLAFVQFPWRLVGRSAGLVAPLAGVGGAVLAGWAGRRLGKWAAAGLASALALLMVGAALPQTYPLQWCPLPGHPTIVDVNRFEQGGLVGLDNEGSYFPLGVEKPHDSPLLADYASGRTPERFDPRALPDGATSEITYHPLGADVTIDTPTAFTARYLTYAFPGWTVTIDGQRAPLEAEPDSGLITFAVPAGEHTIVVRFGPTPLRGLASALSGVTLIALAAIAVLGHWPKTSHEPQPSEGTLTTNSWLALTATGVILLTAAIGWRDRPIAPWQADRMPTPQHRGETVFERQVQLLGYDLDRRTWRADGELRVDSYWRRVGEMSRSTQVALFVLDQNGAIWSEKEGARPRGYENPPLPVFQWPPGTYTVDSQLIRLLPGTPPGDYTLALTLFDRETLQPLTAPRRDEGVNTQLSLGTVEVDWPRSGWQAEDLDIQQPIGQRIGNFTLLGANVDRNSAAVGETALVTLFWENESSESQIVPPLTWEFGDSTLDTVQMTRPTDPVPAGAVWREVALVQVPAEADPGEHLLRVQIGEGEPIEIGVINVNTVERTFEPPALDYELGAQFGSTIQLVGLSTSEKENQLAVTLVWEGTEDTPASYTAFVHALDGQGNILAQSDSIPAQGARPTAGWLPGEVILDMHRLAVEPGLVAALRVGLYDAGTGVRVRLPDGSDAVVVQYPLPD
jgi:hypothetical protein